MGDSELVDVNLEEPYEVLSPPTKLWKEIPATEASKRTVLEGRKTIEAILDGTDPRKFLVVGPCSIHSTKEALDYARMLKQLADKVKDEFYIIMRLYFEKPRTRDDWRGFQIEPDLDHKANMEKGIRLARKLAVDITDLGMPVGTEALYPPFIQHLSDLISWYSIGARSIENQYSRDVTSGLSAPVGFKNGTDGSVEDAVNAMIVAQTKRKFPGIDPEGRLSSVSGKGNPHVHLILRGSGNGYGAETVRKAKEALQSAGLPLDLLKSTGPNYDDEHVKQSAELMKKSGLRPNIVVDCSHGNSRKDYTLQPAVFHEAVTQIMQNPNSPIVGLMLESNLHEGNQKINGQLKYGVSVTDACINWLTTEEIITEGRRRIQHHRNPLPHAKK